MGGVREKRGEGDFQLVPRNPFVKAPSYESTRMRSSDNTSRCQHYKCKYVNSSRTIGTMADSKHKTRERTKEKYEEGKCVYVGASELKAMNGRRDGARRLKFG